MTVNQLQDYVFTSKYGRYLPDQQRRETFEEATDRVLAMHAEHFNRRGIDVEDLLATAGEAMHERLVLGSQRALQFGGAPILRKHARMYNCTTSYCDRPRFFQEALWLLLCGCGVGFSVQHHHIAHLPDLERPTGEEVTFVVSDSIEGWSDALGALMSSYFAADRPHPEFGGKRVRFDFGRVRPKGAPISTGAGKAPGPEPLRRSLELIRDHVDALLARGVSRLRPIDAYDIIMHACDAVLAGGVRRSATICLFSPDDEEMIQAKTGSWFVDNPQRARSNNSAVLLRNGTTREEFDRLVRAVREYGEPGFIWTDHLDVTFNPCVEIGLYPQIDGISGWAFCNLCEINMGAVHSVAQFERAARAAAVLGTLQADYTDFEYLGDVSRRIARREALLGVSMTGMMENPEIALNPDLQRQMGGLVLSVNEEVAQRIGLSPAARATCVKPAGSTSCILGTSSGIHPHHASRYFRRAQANEDEAVVDFFRQSNPLAVERSVWNPNGTDVVLTFCIDAPDGARTRSNTTATDLLRMVKLTKANWIDAGRRPERCVEPWLSHSVSNTITVQSDEWESVADFIYAHRDSFAGISLLPDGGDLDYPQAPFVEVWTAAEIVRHYGVGAIMSSGLIVDGLHAFDDDLWKACDAALDRGVSLDDPLETDPCEVDDGRERKRDWVRRARKFARNYFGDDVLEMTRCLKRVHNCKLWEDLGREARHVDYSQLIEERDETRASESIACGGGACEIL